MFDPDLYREACGELTAPQDKIEEVITMTENDKKKMRPLRAALICAAAVAMMVVGVAAADPEGVQQFVYDIMSAVQVDDYRTDLTTKDGEHVTVYSVPQASLEERDGRAILVIDGKDAQDITDELRANGRYTYENTTDGSHITIKVEGTVDEWKAYVAIGDPDGPVYTFSNDSEGNGIVTAPLTPVPADDGSFVSSFTYDGETLELVPHS